MLEQNRRSDLLLKCIEGMNRSWDVLAQAGINPRRTVLRLASITSVTLLCGIVKFYDERHGDGSY